MNRRTALLKVGSGIGALAAIGASSATAQQRYLDVSIWDTDSPVDAGQWLGVHVSVGTGNRPVTDTVRLYDSSDNLLDTYVESLPRHATNIISLGWHTYPVRQTVTFPVTVRSSGDSDVEEVTVVA